MGNAYFLPAKCLAFYRKDGNCMALIQSVDEKSDGRVTGCRNSILVSHYKCNVRGMERKSCIQSTVPVLIVVYSVLLLEQQPLP